MNGMNGGAEGMAIDGVVIFDSAAGGTDNIFAEAGSFDECGGHPDQSGTYHYHAEPYSISYDDARLIGVMRDGFFLYGRHDADGSTPGSLAAQQAAGAGSGNLVYVYGGHTGTAPVASDTSAFHYHVTEWEGCYDETGGGNGPGSKVADDGFELRSVGHLRHARHDHVRRDVGRQLVSHRPRQRRLVRLRTDGARGAVTVADDRRREVFLRHAGAVHALRRDLRAIPRACVPGQRD